MTDIKPVAHCSLTQSGRIAYFDGKPMLMPGEVGNECHETPLYAAADVAALVRTLLDALTYQGTMGPTRRQRRHDAIAAAEAFLAQQENKL